MLRATGRAALPLLFLAAALVLPAPEAAAATTKGGHAAC